MFPSYYLRYFYRHDEVVAAERGAATRGQQVAEIEAELLRQYADPALTEKPDLLGATRRGVLLRGGRRPHRVAAGKPGPARRQRPQPRHAAVPQ